MPKSARSCDVAFVFGARDALWPDLGLFLSEKLTGVDDSLSDCARIIQARLGWSLHDVLAKDVAIEEFMIEPVTTAVQLAFNRAWRERGIEPSAIVSRCGGEFAAAHASGGVSFEDALDMACRIGELVKAGRGRGTMLALCLSISDAELLRNNCPAFYDVASDGFYTIISYQDEDDLAIRTFFFEKNIKVFRSNSGTALHSAAIDPWRGDLTAPLSGACRDASIPIYSATTGGRFVAPHDWSSHFWRVVRDPVRIRPAIRAALDDGVGCFLEIGGYPGVGKIIGQEALSRGLEVTSLTTMDRLRPVRETMDVSHAALVALSNEVVSERPDQG